MRDRTCAGETAEQSGVTAKFHQSLAGQPGICASRWLQSPKFDLWDSCFASFTKLTASVEFLPLARLPVHIFELKLSLRDCIFTWILPVECFSKCQLVQFC